MTTHSIQRAGVCVVVAAVLASAGPMAEGWAAGATRTLGASETETLFGGVNDRDCGDVSNCLQSANSCLDGNMFDCTSQWERNIITAAPKKNCNKVVSGKTCNDDFPQADCAKEYGCQWNLDFGWCERTNTPYTVHRVSSKCEAQ